MDEGKGEQPAKNESVDEGERKSTPDDLEEEHDVTTSTQASPEGDETSSTGRLPTVMKRFWWAISIVLLLIVAAVVYFIYTYHRNTVYNAYLSGAQNAMDSNEYSLAISDYKQALKINDSPKVQALLTAATALQKQHESYIAGVAAMSAGNDQVAITDFQAVTSQDKADYSNAQREIAKAQAEIRQQTNQAAVSTLVTDGDKILGDITTLNSDVTQIADVENNISGNDYFGSQALTTDMTTFAKASTAISNDVNTLQGDSGQFNTDEQYVNDSRISAVIDKVNQALNSSENDFSDMANIAADNLTSVQNQILNYTNNYPSTPIISSSNTNEWNADISAATDDQNALTNALSELQAYTGSSKGAGSQT